MHKLARALLLLVAAATLSFAHTVDTVVMHTTLSTQNEVPPVTGVNANGSAIVLVHITRDDTGKMTGGIVDFLIAFNFAGAIDFTGLHIHEGPAGQNAGIVIPTDLSGTNRLSHPGGAATVFKQVVVTDTALLGRLLANPSGFYANMHTTANPGGVIRGQLFAADVRMLRTVLSTQNEVPPVTPDASGSASIRLIADRDASGQIVGGVTVFDVNYRFADPSDVTGLHIHNGVAGVNAGVVIGTTGVNQLRGQTKGNYVEAVPITTQLQMDNFRGLFVDPQRFYANIHTTVNPGGVARGQLLNTGTMVLRTDLLPANEVPPTSVQASAPATLTIDYVRDGSGKITGATVTFDVNYAGFPADTQFTGLHIHNAPAGQNAGVIIDPRMTTTSPFVRSATGAGNFFVSANVDADSPAALAAVNDIVANPQNYYMNVHTSVNPGGAIRGQMGVALTANPQISANGIVSSVLDPSLTSASPGALISIFGQNMTATSSDASGLDGGVLPIRMNGTEVRVGSRQAALLFVSDKQINAQVPFDTDTGNAQVFVVRNDNSFSAPFSLNVRPTSPGIFVTQFGAAVVKVSDSSLVSSSNPAAADELLAIFWTGGGKTTPAIANGQLAPTAGPLSIPVAAPTVTIGGVSAVVLGAALAPGFAGLYQVNVRMPSGVGSGNQPVVITAGDQRSNAAMMAVK